MVAVPFKSPKQQVYLKINEPSIHNKWQKEHGNAPGLSEYMKKVHRRKKKTKKSSYDLINLIKKSMELEQNGLFKEADILEREAGKNCVSCGEMLKTSTCQKCGKKVNLCPTCSMKKFGELLCESCGQNIIIESKKLTYKEKQASPCVFPKSHPKVKDNKDHYPILDLAHGANALARSNQDVGSWFDGTAEELRNAVKRAVYKKFPGLKSRKEKRED